ncbi:MAG: hypothetical protein ACI9DC_002901 [Gammaproteobacteria bacterium]
MLGVRVAADNQMDIRLVYMQTHRIRDEERNMANKYSVQAIGTVSCSRTEAFDDHWDKEESAIMLDMSILGESAAAALDSFSHIAVIYLFHQLANDKVARAAMPIGHGSAYSRNAARTAPTNWVQRFAGCLRYKGNSSGCAALMRSTALRFWTSSR